MNRSLGETRWSPGPSLTWRVGPPVEPSRRRPRVSFVVPFYNEEQCIEVLHERICRTMRNTPARFEIVCVDDGSTDATPERLHRLRSRDRRVKIVTFSRNFGHQVAVTAGLRYATGDCVVVMDADLQDPPEVVLAMLDKWRSGYDVAYGVRRTRDAGRLISICYKVFYRIIHRLSPLDMPLDAGDFCLMDRRVVRAICRMGEEQPYVRGLRSWVGFRQIGIPYDRPARAAGETKYPFIGLIKLALDGLLSFSTATLRLSAVTGFVVSALSFVYAVFTFVSRILVYMGLKDSSTLTPGWATLVCSIMFLMGLQLIFIGVLGEYVGRVFMQVKQRPLYVVAEELGFEDEEQLDQRGDPLLQRRGHDREVSSRAVTADACPT